MNKRGDIPITILVIGVFVVCTLAFLSFFASSINLRNSFTGIDVIEYVNLQIEAKQFQNEILETPFYEEVNKAKIWPWAKDELLFSVEYEKP